MWNFCEIISFENIVDFLECYGYWNVVPSTVASIRVTQIVVSINGNSDRSWIIFCARLLFLFCILLKRLKFLWTNNLQYFVHYTLQNKLQIAYYFHTLYTYKILNPVTILKMYAYIDLIFSTYQQNTNFLILNFFKSITSTLKFPWKLYHRNISLVLLQGSTALLSGKHDILPVLFKTVL